MNEYPRETLIDVARAIASHGCVLGSLEQARATLKAAEPYIVTREADATEAERVATQTTIRAREWLARCKAISEAVNTCRVIARKNYRLTQAGKADGALMCVTAVRALVPGEMT